MKKILFTLAIAVCTVTLFNSCSGAFSEDVPSNNVDAIVTKGEWKINQFIQSNTDQSAQFANYTFTFVDSRTVTANQNGTIVTGTWASDNYANRIVLNFGNTPTLSKINQEWLINSQNEKAVTCINNDKPQTEMLGLIQQ